LLLTVSTAVLLFSIGFSAQVRPKIYGVGVESCRDWILAAPVNAGRQAQMEAGARRLATIAWTNGYVTGAAAVLATRGTVLRDDTGSDVLAWLDRHCGGNPTSTIEAASAALVQELAAP
jgi:hypothetical protein